MNGYQRMIALLVAPLLLGAAAARAADQLVPGTKLLLKSANGREVLSFKSTGPFTPPTPGSGDDPSNVGAMYYRIYFQIGMANEFLRQTTDAKLDSRGNVGSALRADIKQYRAEARFLRALSYWHGIDMFGDIPLITEADLVGAVPQPSTRTNVYNFIVSELNAILPDLPPAA